tara:strand:+ start:435 stop:1703 length:1269 start_codon:yes stop_codon:yes gene_type:complete
LSHIKLFILIKVLKKEIAKKIKREIKSSGDCIFLSNAIFEILDIDISYNTIRRFYNLLPSTNPSIKTLNTLAQFIGYRNYIDFTQNFKYKEKINLTEIIYKSVAENNNEEIVNFVNKSKKSSEDFISLVIILIRELWHNGNYRLINRIFNLKALNFDSFSYDEVLKLGNSIGLLIRKKNKLHPLLLNNINFLDCVFLIFVDYSSLNKYYGDALEIIKKNNIRYDITLFSTSVLEFRNFINNVELENLNINRLYKKQLHSILIGRLLSLKLLSLDSNKTLGILNAHHKSLTLKDNLINHYYELFTTSILLKNLEIMNFLISRITQKVEFYYQKTHLNSFYLMCLFYYKLTGDIENETKILKSFKLSDSRHSYEEFINLIYLIYLYDSTTTKTTKMNIRTRYKSLNKKLNYPYFSEDLLLNYFN